MITAFLLAPVLVILLWLYARLLPESGSLRFFDYSLFTIVIILSAVFVHFVENTDWHDTGPLWPELVAAVGVYGILLGGLAAGLFWRRYKD
jgi:hypothetical protein